MLLLTRRDGQRTKIVIDVNQISDDKDKIEIDIVVCKSGNNRVSLGFETDENEKVVQFIREEILDKK